MRISKKDITAFFVLFLGTIVCVRYFYKHMNDEQFVATVDPYSLVVPSPTAIFAINRPPVFEKMILPMENIRKAFSDHTPAIFLSLIRQNLELSSFLIAYYPQGDVLYAPMDSLRQSVFSSNWTSLSLFRPSNERKPPFLLDIILMLISIF